MQQYLKAFLEQRNSWATSITNQSNFINQLSDIIDGTRDVVQNVTANYSRISSSIAIGDDVISGEYLDSEGQSHAFSVNIEGLEPDTVIPGLNISVATLMSDVLQSQQVNSALAQINDVMLNYGEISVVNANAIIDSCGTGGYNSDMQDLKSIINSSGGELLQKEQWGAILYNFNKEVQEKAENDELVLDTNTKVVKQYVGTAIIGFLSTVAQIIGAVLVTVTRILGFILLAIGALVSWLVGATVNTDFQLDYSALNDELSTPTNALTVPFGRTPDFVPNSGAFLREALGRHYYHWRTKTTDENNVESDIRYCNTYLDLSIDGSKVRDYLLDNHGITTTQYSHSSASQRLGVTFTSDRLFTFAAQGSDIEYRDPRQLFNWCLLLNDDREDLHHDAATLLANSTNDDFWYEQIFLSFGLSVLSSLVIWNQTQNEVKFGMGSTFSLGTDAEIVWYANSSPYGPDYSAKGVARAALQYLLSSDSEREHIKTTWHSAFINYCSHVSDVLAAQVQVQTIGSIDDLHAVEISKMSTSSPITGTPAIRISYHLFLAPLWDMYDAKKLSLLGDIEDRSFSDNEMISLSALPAKHLVTWPDYAPSALLKTLLIVAGITIVGVAAGSMIRKAYGAWKLKASTKSAAKVQAAKAAFDADPTLANAKKLNKAQNWYNFKAKIFGWNRYDAINNWYTPASEAGGDTESSFTIADVEEIKKLIKN